MEGMHFLRDLLIAFVVAGVVVFLFHRLRLPSVVGLLAAGVLAGPHGLALIRDADSIQKLSDIGVVVLLFAVGLDRGAPTMRVVLPHREVLERLETASCWIRDKSPAVGQTVGELRLRSATGATLVAVRRTGTLQLNPGPDFRFQADDTVVLIGDRSQLNKAMCLLDPNLEESAVL